MNLTINNNKNYKTLYDNNIKDYRNKLYKIHKVL